MENDCWDGGLEAKDGVSPATIFGYIYMGLTHVTPVFLRPGQEANTSSRCAWTPQGVPGHAGLHSENLSQTNQQKWHKAELQKDVRQTRALYHLALGFVSFHTHLENACVWKRT